ncbi:STM4014 family protein [Streptomyces albipurpureus]|uniref:STM4014 family protein n=1 Tax=Streptomyces albipurpureus TaxID=2897419 RepID=A0ABT0UEN2_9ACTN|nr:STM4014 family protein [Streptomyces sp. CWNU-1]MCM2386759.1 STM4014 family protein [Streptomyces sp. CWNU-1]
MTGTRAPSAPLLVVIGNPTNRRVALFQQAARAARLPDVRVVPWLAVLRGQARFHAGELVRLDSPGEDAEVERELRGVDDPTRVEGTARWYERFTAAVRDVASAVAAAGGTLLDDPQDLAVLFDKRLCHGVLREAGIAVPQSPTSGPDAPLVRGWADVRALQEGTGLRRVFIKLAHGSSASGVLAVETASGGRVQATTSVERDGRGRLFNSLRVRRYSTEREVGALVDALAPDGLHIERWLPKASQGGRTADLRVVVIAGRATHAVVRTSRSPMTNLHLGGARGDLAAARTSIEIAGGDWAGALRLCEAAAERFPGSLRVGVDLLPSPDWRGFSIGEVNGFGDLLPGLTGLPGSGAETQETYAAQISAVRSRCATLTREARAAPGALEATAPPAPIKEASERQPAWRESSTPGSPAPTRTRNHHRARW